MNLKLSEIPGGKPAEEPGGGSGGSSGCDAGMAGLAVLTLAGCVLTGRRRG